MPCFKDVCSKWYHVIMCLLYIDFHDVDSGQSSTAEGPDCSLIGSFNVTAMPLSVPIIKLTDHGVPQCEKYNVLDRSISPCPCTCYDMALTNRGLNCERYVGSPV